MNKEQFNDVFVFAFSEPGAMGAGGYIDCITDNGLGQIGYVANSVTTRKGVSYSAGRLVDKIENNTCATIEYVLSYGAICSLKGEVVNG